MKTKNENSSFRHRSLWQDGDLISENERREEKKRSRKCPSIRNAYKHTHTHVSFCIET